MRSDNAVFVTTIRAIEEQAPRRPESVPSNSISERDTLGPR